MRSAVEARPPEDGRPRTHVHLKVVPGGSRSGLAGTYGDRIKVKVAAPPEGGKANKAVLALLADVLGAPVRDLLLVRGTTQPLKTVEVRGLDAEAVGRVLYGEAR